MKFLNTNLIVWFIYISLLAVLLPHTAWVFAKFEPEEGVYLAWALAFAFELSLAIFTHKLAKHIEGLPNYKGDWKRFKGRYLNAYGGGLFIAWSVSTLANLAHSVEFGQRLEIFEEWGIPFSVYAVAFGGILPLMSFLFARVLSNASDTEHGRDIELEESNKQVRALSKELRTSEQRYEAIGDVVVKLFSDSRQDRILAAHSQWPELPQRSIAIMANASVSRVNQVINGEFVKINKEIE